MQSLSVAIPVTADTRPTGHDVQSDGSGLADIRPYVPAMHTMHVVSATFAAVLAYLPAAHAMQELMSYLKTLLSKEEVEKTGCVVKHLSKLVVSLFTGCIF